MMVFLNSHYKKNIFLLQALLLASILSFTQEKKINHTTDSIRSETKMSLNESAILKKHSPRTAAIRSAILPGLGQIYNKKYWKLPLVYGAIGTTVGVFIYSFNNYRDTRFAYNAKFKASLQPPLRDSTDYYKIKPELLPLSQESLRSYRNQFRRDVDYWALFILLAWSLNVVDATVDAHLKSFDVSPDLSLQIKPGRSEMARTSGISLVLNIGKNISK